MRSNERNRYKSSTHKDTHKQTEICRLDVKNRLNIKAILRKVTLSSRSECGVAWPCPHTLRPVQGYSAFMSLTFRIEGLNNKYPAQ